VSESGSERAVRVRSRSPEETEAVAAELAAGLEAGDVVLISGDLGAGKTTFVRGAARELGVTEPVTSPTFTIGQTYAGVVPVSHLGLYRLSEVGAEDVLGDEDAGLLEDYLIPAAVAFVEWPSIARRLVPDPAAFVAIELAADGSREIRIERRCRT
jgi:tRNA threonylcarbamoyladenosine biosynthesis protein TsaE